MPSPVPAARVIAVIGPTAVGKSALGVELAARLGAEIVNADAMQLYAGMDIGTAKLSPAERGGVPHHLLDIWPVTARASVADYQRLAREQVGRLLDAGTRVVVVGGSGLYVQALLDDLRFPGTDDQLRAALEAELERVGPAALHRRLAGVDPAAALRILPGNGRRIVRALEVIELTGAPYPAQLPPPRAVHPGTVLLGLDLPDPELDRRIELRVAQMFASGLVDEVAALVGRGLRDGVTARLALGYRQILEAEQEPVADYAAAAVRTAAATRRYARRQRGWFRRDLRVRWLRDPAEALAVAVG